MSSETGKKNITDGTSIIGKTRGLRSLSQGTNLVWLMKPVNSHLRGWVTESEIGTVLYSLELSEQELNITDPINYQFP